MYLYIQDKAPPKQNWDL